MDRPNRGGAGGPRLGARQTIHPSATLARIKVLISSGRWTGNPFEADKVNSGSGFPTLRADISGGASSVSIDLGDYDSDADGLFLNVYDASNNLLGSASLVTDPSDETMHTLGVGLPFPGIAYAEFGSTVPSVGGSSVYSDNFSWTPAVSAVPEPTLVILLSTMLLAVAFGARKRIAHRL